VLLAGDELHDRLEAFRRQNSGGAASGQGRIVVKPQLQVRPPVIICRRIRPWLLSQSGRMVVRKCSFPLSRLRSFMHSVVSQFWTNSLRTDILHPTDTNFFHPNLIISPPATSVYFPKYINHLFLAPPLMPTRLTYSLWCKHWILTHLLIYRPLSQTPIHTTPFLYQRHLRICQ